MLWMVTGAGGILRWELGTQSTGGVSREGLAFQQRSKPREVKPLVIYNSDISGRAGV